VRLSAAVGVNVTVMVHGAPGATRPSLHVVVAPKSPVATTAVIVSGLVPTLVTVTVCPALVVWISCAANVSVAGATATAGATPCPVSPTGCGLLGASSAICSVAVWAPGVAG